MVWRKGGGGSAARQGPSKETINFVMKELAAKGGFDSDFNGRTLMTSAEDNLGAELRLPVRDNGKPFTPVAYENTSYRQLVDQLTTAPEGKAPPFGTEKELEAAWAAAHGADGMTAELQREVLSDAKAHGAFMRSAYMGTGKGAYAALQTAGPMLVGKEVPQQLLEVMNLTEDKLRAKYGNGPADSFRAEVAAKLEAGKVQEALDQVGVTNEHLKTVVKPEVNTVEGFSAPLLKDMPAWGQAVAIGGVGGASTALAMHLMAQGQQQQSSADYAAAMQALNAY